MGKINMDKLRAAHEAELREASVKPGLLILPSIQANVLVKFRTLMDSSAYYSGIAKLLKDCDAEHEAQDNMDKAACRAFGRVEGAKLILKAIGLDMDKIETEGSGKT